MKIKSLWLANNYTVQGKFEEAEIKVMRRRNELKTGKCVPSVETSYYLTNEVGNYEELKEAIRKHWQVETNNHIRDVTLKEDRLRSKKRMSIE